MKIYRYLSGQESHKIPNHINVEVDMLENHYFKGIINKDESTIDWRHKRAVTTIVFMALILLAVIATLLFIKSIVNFALSGVIDFVPAIMLLVSVVLCRAAVVVLRPWLWRLTGQSVE